MEGIQFVVDDTGKRTAVVIDLKKWGKYWEDFYDILISELRRDESTVTWDELKAEMIDEEKTTSV